LYATAIRPISVLDASLGYQSYANSIPFQWTYNVTKPVTPVTYAPGTLAPVGTNSTSALIIAPELLPAIIIPAVVAGVVLTLVIVVGVMARHKSTRGTVKKLFHGNKCTGARDSKKKKPSAGTTDNERGRCTLQLLLRFEAKNSSCSPTSNRRQRGQYRAGDSREQFCVGTQSRICATNVHS
jgi:hypothetical protein